MQLKNFKPATLSALLIIVAAMQAFGQNKIHALKIRNIQELCTFFKYKEQHQPIISGHRVAWLKANPYPSIKKIPGGSPGSN